MVAASSRHPAHDTLLAHWNETLGRVRAADAGSAPEPAAYGEDLLGRWAEPQRRYHGTDHLLAVLDRVDELAGHAADPDVVRLAAWFHDAVHDPRSAPGADEGASAVLARQALASLGATLTATGEVCRLICLTADHDPTPGDRTGALLCDADLAILAAADEDYDAYVAAVRAEYAHVDDDGWRSGRRAVLRSFLDRPAIFRTVPGRERWEARARINISTELSRLGS